MTSIFILNTSFADRISGSQFMTTTIKELGKCQKRQTRIIFDTKLFNPVATITGHTSITQNKKKITCHHLKVGQRIKLGYAQGDDTGLLKNGYIIVDSIEVLSNN